jgi:D-methionine transport system substrate-binding protein
MKSRYPSLLALLLVALLALGVAGCGDDSDETASADLSDTPLKVGASPTPHAEILEYINTELAPDAGLKLDIVSYDDYIQPNVALEEKKLDVNYFQHQPYLDQQIKDNPSYKNFKSVGAVHLEPLGVYSNKVKDVKDVPEGGTVTISNDPSNEARGLRLLESAGLITLKPDAGDEATPNDIAENSKNLKFKTIAPANLPRTLDDADLAVINGNYALEAKLNPADDALQLESASDNPYANLLVARDDNADDPRVKKLIELLQSDETTKFIETKYKGSVIPAS